MLWPAPIWPTIIPTVTRIPRMHGFPPITPGSCVMRSSCAILFSRRIPATPEDTISRTARKNIPGKIALYIIPGSFLNVRFLHPGGSAGAPSAELHAPIECRHRRSAAHGHVRLLDVVGELRRSLQVVFKRFAQRPQPANPLVLR